MAAGHDHAGLPPRAVVGYAAEVTARPVLSSLEVAGLDDRVRCAGADIILARPLWKSDLIDACIAAEGPGEGPGKSIACAR